MLCDSCGERDAVVQLTRIEGGEVKLLHLCERCAAENGVETSAPTPKHPSGPGSSQRPARDSFITLAAMATQLPPSATNMLSPAARATASSSFANRKWWIGT